MHPPGGEGELGQRHQGHQHDEHHCRRCGGCCVPEAEALLEHIIQQQLHGLAVCRKRVDTQLTLKMCPIKRERDDETQGTHVPINAVQTYRPENVYSQ